MNEEKKFYGNSLTPSLMFSFLLLAVKLSENEKKVKKKVRERPQKGEKVVFELKKRDNKRARTKER